jgi:hypothetical protein
LAGVFEVGLEKEGLPVFAKAGLLVGSEDVRSTALAEVPLRWTLGPFEGATVLERGCNDMS